MKTQRTPLVPPVAWLGFLLLACDAHAASIGVNFTGANAAGTPTLLAPEEEAGVVPQRHWNNIRDLSLSNYPLNDDAPKLTDVTITFSTAEMWGSEAFNEDLGVTNGNAKLLNGYLNSRTGADRTNTVIFNGVPLGATYTVIAYTVRDNPGAQAAYSINDDTNTAVHILTEAGDFWTADPQFRRGTNTVVFEGGFVVDEPANYGNYVRWDNVAPRPDGSVVVSVASEPNLSGDPVERGPINGIQLISSQPFPRNTAVPKIVLQPRNVRVSLGQPGVFRATTDGPWLFQWFSNDVAIAGATSNILTTLPIASIEDTRTNYKVVVSNDNGQVTSDSVHLVLVPSLPPGGIFYDGFDYPVGILGNWGEWSLENIAAVTAPGLTYSDGENSLQVSGNALVPPREPAGWINFKYIPVKSFGTTVYGGPNSTNFMSFLYDFRDLTAEGGIGVSGFLGTGDWGNERFFIGKVYGEEVIGFDSGPPRSLSEFTIYTNAFVVVRIIQDEFSATFDLFINPSLTRLPGEPILSAVRDGTVEFDGVGVNAGDWNRPDPQGPGPIVDEFRFGSTYDSVAPIQTAMPALGIALKGTDIEISWLPVGSGYTLQSADSVTATSWTDVPGSTPVTIPASGTTRFFRLIKQ